MSAPWSAVQSCARVLLVFFLAALPAMSAFAANRVVQSLGVDRNVDYASLAAVGPWDDRNYQLTAAGVALLSDDEASARDPIPAFFRVELRRANPGLGTTGPAQYPRSALQRFERKYYGYLINGRIYKELRVASDGTFEVILDDGLTQKEYLKAMLAAEIRVSGPAHGGAETAIAINPANTNRVIAGSNGPYQGQTMWYSADGGTTWTRPTDLAGANICCDPTVAWSGDGLTAYTATLGNGVYVYRSSNNGQTWSSPVIVPTTDVNVDKEYLHVDTQPLSPHYENVYICWHLNGVQKFSRSTDRGATFGTPVSFSSSSAFTGIGCDIASDSGGNVYYFYPAYNSRQIKVAKSTDGGLTFATPSNVAATQGSFDFPIPAMSARHAFIYTSADVDLSGSAFRNTIYVAFTDSTASTGSTPANNHARIQVAFSRDGGASWQVRTPHPTTDANTVDRFHPWLKVDNNGRVHVVFYDTVNSAARTGVDFYYSHSENGGESWSSPTRLTSLNMPKPTDGFEWGDYNGMDMALTKALGIYTDNRSEDAAGNTVDAYATADFAVTGTLPDSDIIFANGFD
ncbi:MAG TPA: sialidase family protein [Dokdonella sp.]|nr:sialidase family protein [Dokdonella sp.]